MRRRRALVIGGSLGGLFAANLLRGVGWDVCVHERARADLAGRGAGLGTRDELFAVLRRLGIALDGSLGAEVRSRICLDRDGGVMCELPIGTVTTAWDSVYGALKGALPAELHRGGMQLRSIEQDNGRIAAIFVDGSRHEGDLLVAADGIHSTARRQFAPDCTPRYAGYVAWRGVATEDDVPAPHRERVFNHMNFCLPAGELALSIPMPVSGSGRRRSQFTWFRPVEEASKLPSLCTDANGRHHGLSIPPPLIRPELIDAVKAQARAVLAPQMAALVAGAPQLILQPIVDLETPRMAFGRAVLLGDAAFVARPHVGTGVTKAALDAQCLADVLAADRDIEAALARYDHARRRFGHWLVARGRHLAAHVTGPHGRAPGLVLREFGGAGVIDGAPADAWRW
jgi:2-polyprenyl-6-methoxyphenol hydroxylase-like FAD-dependent oxidoreductase